MKKNELEQFLLKIFGKVEAPKKQLVGRTPELEKKKKTGAYFNSGKKKLSIESHSQSD